MQTSRGILRAPLLVLILLCAFYVILYIDRTNIAAAAPLMKADFHFNNTQMGAIFSAFAIPFAAFQLVGGSLVIGLARV